MVGVLIRMRLLLTLRALSSGWQGFSFVMGVLVGSVFALITAAMVGFAVRDGDAAHATTVAATIFGIWTLGWLCGPVLFGSSDETVQPEHLRLLPLSDRQLATGLLAAAFAGPAPVINLIAFGGLVVLAAQWGWAAMVVAVAGVVLQLVFVVLLSRVVLAWVGAAMRSRRGKDLGVLLAGLVGLAYYPMSWLLSHVSALRDVPPPVASALRWIPSGWAPAAVEAAAQGNWLFALLPLVGLLVVVLGLWQAWAVLLARRLAAPMNSVAGGTGGGLLARVRQRGPLGAVLIKELRTWSRDSRRRATVLPVLVVGVLLPVFPAVQGGGTGGVPFAGVTSALFASLAGANLYGYDGTAVWQTLVTPGAERADARGRLLALLIVIGLPTTLLSLILPGALGRWELYPWVLSLHAAALGAGVCSALVLSVIAPYPLPPRTGNPFSGSGNPGCAKAMIQLAMMVGQLLAVLPVAIVLLVGHFTEQKAVEWVALPVGVAVCVAAVLFGGHVAEQRLTTGGPELLDAVRPR
ncbi:ABC-2 type transport system permease protein [Nocardia tenerifensis]|uniref:ABC-2 type transport system permease protein n=1 Tax=Nocardia tenerifensis TaxID=228006 RepID=A0A318K9W9_9NOCA|nr:hypothetical protein [Nocardia tenerifensis]PXX61492.1 ABC-2 type transport system permease protein [Nocardia tenerifensis]